MIFVGSLVVITAQGSMPALADALTLAEIRRFVKVGLNGIQFGRVRVGGSFSTLGIMLFSGTIVAIFPGERIISALALLALLPFVATMVAAARTPKIKLPRWTHSGLTQTPPTSALHASSFQLPRSCRQVTHRSIRSEPCIGRQQDFNRLSLLLPGQSACCRRACCLCSADAFSARWIDRSACGRGGPTLARHEP